MNAPVEAEACDLVLLPANLSINGCRVSLGSAQASAIVVVSRIAAGGVFHGRSRHL